MKMAHTPALWNVTNLDTAETVFYIGGQSGSIASAWNKGGGEGEANARLIAAAPELLEALIKASGWINAQMDTMNDEQRSSYDFEVINKVTEAIAKATK